MKKNYEEPVIGRIAVLYDADILGDSPFAEVDLEEQYEDYLRQWLEYGYVPPEGSGEK